MLKSPMEEYARLAKRGCIEAYGALASIQEQKGELNKSLANYNTAIGLLLKPERKCYRSRKILLRDYEMAREQILNKMKY